MTCGNMGGFSSENITIDSGARYNMGTSEKLSVHIPTFLQWNDGDPAIKVRHFISSVCVPPQTSSTEFFLKVERPSPSPYSGSTSAGG